MTNEELERKSWGRRHLHLYMIGRLMIDSWNLFQIRLVCFYYHRTRAEQQKLFEEGRSKCDGVKKPSKHQRWLAHDLCIVDETGRWIGFGDIPLTEEEEEQYRLVGALWEGYHPRNKYGGNFRGFKEVFHFQSF